MKSFNQFLKENSEQGSNKPLIVVDIQAAYSGIYDGDENPMFEEAIEYTQNTSRKVFLLYNGDETGTTDESEDNVKQYWEDNGFDPDNWNNIYLYDKGYGYLTSWMDNGITEETIIKVIQTLEEIAKYDSRDIPGRQLRALVGDEWEDWMEDDPITIGWLPIDELRKHSSFNIIGGGENECLAEVQIMLDAYNINYTVIQDYVY